MKKILMAALLMGVSALMTRPALAEDLIHRDDSPKNCSAKVNDQEQAVCEQFLLLESEDFLYFVFRFNGTPTIFVAPDQPIKTEELSGGLVANSYFAPLSITGEEKTEIEGFCTWIAPETALFGGMASCTKLDGDNDLSIRYSGHI